MTVSQLIKKLEELPKDLEIEYKYEDGTMKVVIEIT